MSAYCSRNVFVAGEIEKNEFAVNELSRAMSSSITLKGGSNERNNFESDFIFRVVKTLEGPLSVL